MKRGGELVAGVDEAGRGPLAGPVACAAVILDPRQPIEGLGDSKALSEAARERLFPIIQQRCLAWSVVLVDREEIDELNILWATMAGMQRAVAALSVAPTRVLVDGNRIPRELPCPAKAIVGGDAIEPAIMAASILAKVTRDRWMLELHQQFPDYGFDRHKGYPTADHLAALTKFGACPAHRRSFAPVRERQLALW